MSVLVALSVTPQGTSDGSSESIAEAVRAIRESGLANQTHSMSTVIEGKTWDEVMPVVQRAVEAVAARAPRVSALIDVDWRSDGTNEMDRKVAAVEQHLSQSAS